MNHRVRKWLGIALTAIISVAIGASIWWLRKPPLPPEFFASNGRLEATQVDIATKLAGRLDTVSVREGETVKPGDVVARMDIRNLEANLREEQANLDGAMEAKYAAEATLAGRVSELAFAKDEYLRTVSLVKQNFIAQQQADLARTKLDTAQAQVKAARSSVSQREAEIKAAQAKVDNVKANLDDSVLKSPILGRVLYRVGEPGEVLAVGGKILTLFELTDVYMTVFVPTKAVGNVLIGSEARIIFDALPKTPIPARVSFVSPEAQFTPKQVETEAEREKLMFRVKVHLDPQLLLKYKELVKTGVPGVVYFRLDPKAQWPKNLEPPQGL